MIPRPPYLTHPARASAGCICMFNRYVDEIRLRDNEPRLHSVALPLTFHYSCCSLTPSPSPSPSASLWPAVCSQQCANQIINCSQWRKSFRAELQHCHHQPRGHGDLSSPFAHNSRFGKTRCVFSRALSLYLGCSIMEILQWEGAVQQNWVVAPFTAHMPFFARV